MKTNTIYEIVSNLEQAFAFFDQNGDLKHYNKVCLDLWRLHENITEEESPSIADFFSIIIENGSLIITESPSDFIKNIASTILQKNLNISRTILCNPNKVVSEKIISLQDGVLFTWKDNTVVNNLHKEASIVNSNISQIIKHIPIPLLFIESNGKVIEQSNYFNQSLGVFCQEGMHIRKIFEELKDYVQNEDDLKKIIESIFNQQEYSNVLKNEDGESIYIKVIPMLSSKSLLFISLEQKELDVLENIDFIKESLQQNYKNIYLKLNTYINNPLTNAKNYLELVTKEYAGSLNKRQSSFLNKVHENIEDIANQLYYHVENINISQKSHSLDDVIVGDIIATTIINLKQTIEQKQISLELEIEDHLSIKSDKNQLTKLINLMCTEIIENLPYKGILKIKSNEGCFFSLHHNCQSVLFTKNTAVRDIKTLLVFNILDALNIKINQIQEQNLNCIKLTK